MPIRPRPMPQGAIRILSPKIAETQHLPADPAAPPALAPNGATGFWLVPGEKRMNGITNSSSQTNSETIQIP